MSKEQKQEKTRTSKPKRDDKGRLLPGHTANPNGRPKGSVSVVSAIKRKLEEEYPEASNEQKRTYLDKIVAAYFEEIIEGKDKTLLKDVIDRVDGKPIQTNKIEGKIETNELEERNQLLKKFFDEEIRPSTKDSTKEQEE